LTRQPSDGDPILDPITALALFKGIEICVESIPGAFIQLSAMLTSEEEIGTMKIVSFISSVLIVTATINELDWRKDTNFNNRTVLKAFYGLLPESGLKKTLVTFAMAWMTASQFFVRVMLCVLLWSKSGRLLGYGLSLEVGVYLAYKAARRDLRSWYPLPGAASVVASAIHRVLLFELVAASSLLQGRHPTELGGAGWMLTHVLSHGGLLVCSFWLNFDGISWNMERLQAIEGGAVCGWWLAFGLLLFNGEKGYKHTFFTTTTSKQFQRQLFDNGSDETKSKLFSKH